ncbi:glycoside hydrolase family 16 protein [Paeniglutamicibacter sulfureus]|uniref:glycoside hydrolase family 16 protein n=1 Tax=Paeniglutamicibacter sulfureus TaxID=43666 RepID=UPI002665DF16|nr:glycoside hydrolase family 16 protein [Paeniglutamicibacter sulfureus]MDO2933186.1 glycoside hydrolase family 16 protein [Paeniglutamicibacter sulfureus]
MFNRIWGAAIGAAIALSLVFSLATSTRHQILDTDFSPLASAVGTTGTNDSPRQGKPADPAGESEPGASVVPVEPADERILLDERFDENTLNESIWNRCHWWDKGGCTIATNNELEWYMPEQAKIANGILNLTAEDRRVYDSEGKPFDYASGMVTTGPPAYDKPAKFAFTYGKVEVRLKMPAGRGLWPAIWMLPASTEPVPEVDLLELLGHKPGILRMRMHPKNDAERSLGHKYAVPGGYTLTEGWHTVGLDWTPGRLKFFLDGKQVWQLDDERVPDEPMYLVMNLAVGGDFPGNPDESTVFPATMSIDHVRILKND